MNIIIRNNKELYYVCSWINKNDTSTDSKGKKFPIPEEGIKWLYSEDFIKKIKILEKVLDNSKKFLKFENKKPCFLCNKSYSTGTYKLDKYIWEDNLTHYVEKHNIKPPEEFIDFIMFSKFNNTLRLESRIIKDDGKKFIKINKNQLLILDALLEHGGYNQKYADLKNKNIFRYSEHSGLFDFNSNKLQKIVVLGNTNRVDKGDNEIYMPNNVEDMFNYEYIFHTHPPTPKPGGRAEFGILYELPSIGDILHFLDHFNDGKISGSIVITSEGLYNIRNRDLTPDKISIDEDALFAEYNKVSRKIQENSIKKYGIKFTQHEFFSKIAQDTDLINQMNIVLNKFNINIDYIPRIQNEKEQWIIDTLYLPIYK
jgi:hypothetical protein